MMQLNQPGGHACTGRRCSRANQHSLIRRLPASGNRYVSSRAFFPDSSSFRTSQPSFSTENSPTSSRDGESSSPAGSRQTYIQESISFTGAELAARLPSMQAAMRARAEASASAFAGSPPSAAVSPGPGAASSSNSSSFFPSRAAAPSMSRSSMMPPSVASGSNPYAASAAAASAAAVAAVSVSERPSATAATTSSPSSSYTSATASYSSFTAAPPSPSSMVSPPTSPPASSVSNPSAAPVPAASNLTGLSASQKLEALQQVQAVSRQALAAASSPSSPYYVNAPKTIDVRMYDQLVVAHNKLSKKLGETNAHIDVLESQLARSNEDLMAAFELLKQIAMEFGTTSRLAQSTAAAVQFGVDPQDALDKISKLQERLSTLEQAVLEQRQEFGLRVVRQVPVEWIGVASEVRVMGDFDGWTRGHELSAEDVTTDSVYSRFEGTLMLRPGSYRVKFLVDNEWRLAGDWPTEDDAEGNTVNVLTVG